MGAPFSLLPMNMILVSPPFGLSPSEMGTLHTIPGDQYIHTRTLNFQSISAARKMLGDSRGGRCYLIWGVFYIKCIHIYIYISFALHQIVCVVEEKKIYPNVYHHNKIIQKTLHTFLWGDEKEIPGRIIFALPCK